MEVMVMYTPVTFSASVGASVRFRVMVPSWPIPQPTVRPARARTARLISIRIVVFIHSSFRTGDMGIYR